MAYCKVTEAYTTDHYPLGGELSEEILVLADGRALYYVHGLSDEPCASRDEAFALCIGTPVLAPLLWNRWQDGGYDMGDEDNS